MIKPSNQTCEAFHSTGEMERKNKFVQVCGQGIKGMCMKIAKFYAKKF